MRIIKIIAIAATVVLGTSMASTQAYGSERKKKDKPKSKKELIKENEKLKKKTDSLALELEKYMAELEKAYNMQDMEGLMDNDSLSINARPLEYTAEVTDSLYNIWILQKMGEDELPQIALDSVTFSSDVPDSVYIKRIKDMNSFITLPYNSIVKNYIIMYSEKMKKSMSRIMGLSDYYMPIFQETFNRYNIPEELKAMAVIESMLNPTAVSRAGAKGMWQFMYSTAKLYGLTINSFVDERLDPVKSADAAARYLKDSYEIFGDWNLAIASYNCGAGNVKKAIRRSGGKRAFWDIYPYLPKETRGYVPAFVGALYAMKYYKEHGIEPIDAEMPAAIDTFKVHKMLHFKQLSEYAGIPHNIIKDLNPQYRHEIIPGNEKEYILRIPYQYSNNFIDKEDSLYNYKADVFFNPVTIKKIKDGGDGQMIVYKVKSGDVLGSIALRNRCTVAQIKKWNHLKSNNIRIGQRLVLYSGGKGPVYASSSSSKSNSSTASSKPIDKNSPYTLYTVQNGDSLYLIAKKFPGVSAQNIMSFNGIGTNIKPGMKLKIPKL